MPALNYMSALRYCWDLLEDAESDGLELSLETDFDELKHLCRDLPGKTDMYPMFDPDRAELGEVNAFWIKGLADGKVVHTQAIRRFDLGTGCLAGHFSDYRRLYAPAALSVDLEKSEYSLCEVAHKVSGVVCYQGEFWVDESKRGRSLALALGPLALTLAQMQFDPSYLFGFGDPPLPYRGVINQYGYTQLHPLGIRWRDQKGKILRDDWLALMTRSDIVNFVRHVGTGYRPEMLAQSRKRKQSSHLQKAV